MTTFLVILGIYLIVNAFIATSYAILQYQENGWNGVISHCILLILLGLPMVLMLLPLAFASRRSLKKRSKKS